MSGGHITPGDIVAMMFTHITEQDAINRELEASLHNEADLHRKRIQAEADAWRTVRGRNREEREAYVKEMCAEQIFQHEVAQATSKSLLKAADAKRQALSALQSAAKTVEAEATFSRVGPNI